MLKLSNKICDIAITFAEAGEFDTTRGLLHQNEDQAQPCSFVSPSADECHYRDNDVCFAPDRRHTVERKRI